MGARGAADRTARHPAPASRAPSSVRESVTARGQLAPLHSDGTTTIAAASSRGDAGAPLAHADPRARQAARRGTSGTQACLRAHRRGRRHRAPALQGSARHVRVGARERGGVHSPISRASSGTATLRWRHATTRLGRAATS